jgi:hypothetical protein
MRRIVSLGIFASAFSMMAFGASMSGSLLDEACYSQQKQATQCEAKMSTTSFALLASGKVYKLDTAGNEKASAALKARADRSADPAHPSAPSTIVATVTGNVSGDTIQVESINIQ